MNHPKSLLLILLACSCMSAMGAEQDIIIEKGAKATLNLSGYSGEVEKVLRYDLSIAGIPITDSAEGARYAVVGGNSSAVEGQVTDRAIKAVILSNRRYSGGTLRSQAHKFADEIIEKILGLPGIAQTKIAFKCEIGGNSEIYVADYDGANAVAVTSDKALVAAPCWVPGQFALYYTSYKSGFPDVYSQNLSTGQRRVVARYPGLNTSAAVSPDRTKVALILSKNGSPDLYVCNADGTNPQQLTKTREDESSPCWSPDGKFICFCSRMRGSPALYIISAAGGTPRKLNTAGAGSSLTEPDWSPDGKWIAFTAIRARGFELCMVPVEGGSFTALSSGSDPSWAPNSRTIIFTRQDNGRQRLSLLDVVTKQVKDVPQNLGSCSQPSWAK